MQPDNLPAWLAAVSLASVLLFLAARLAYWRTVHRLRGNRGAERHYQHAQTLFLARDYRFARIHLREALVLDPGHYYARLLLAQCHEQLGRPRSAARTYRSAFMVLKDQTTHAQAIALAAYSISCLRAEAGRHPEALHWLQISIDYEPGYAREARHEARFERLSTHPRFERLVNGPLALGLRA